MGRLFLIVGLALVGIPLVVGTALFRSGDVEPVIWVALGSMAAVGVLFAGLGLLVDRLGSRMWQESPRVEEIRAQVRDNPAYSHHYAVQELLREGRKVEAIKVYREATGASLKEAKDAVEHIERLEKRWRDEQT